MSAPAPHEDPQRPRAERIALVGYDYAARQKEFVRTCNLCGSEAWTTLTHRDRFEFLASATACMTCGLTILNPRMTAAEYSKFYDGVYRPLVSAFHGRRIDAVTIQAEQRVYAEEIDRTIGPYLTGRQGDRFLDVGGSTGVVASYFAARHGLRATVIDPAPAELAQAASSSLEVIRGFIEDWDPAGARFGIVGMFQTIDHLLDVAATLRKIRTVLDDDGLFVVDVIDFRAAYLRNWRVEAAVKIDHPYSLVQQTAEAYLARAGFRVVRKAYSADHLHVLYVCRPCAPDPDRLPKREWVEAYFDEIRYVQNAPDPRS